MRDIIQVAIVDDHALIRAGIRELIDKQNDMAVVGEGGTGREAITLFNELKPDVLMLDMELPDMDGLEVISQLISLQPEATILVLTMFSSEELATRALKAGARGFLVKGISPGELPLALRHVAQGGVYVASSLKDKLLASQFSSSGDTSPVARLSKRELQVLTELAQGLNMRQVADKLCLSHSTIKTHKSSIQKKLGLQNISDFIHFALRHDLIKKY